MRIEPARPRPDHDVPRDVRGQRRVDQQAAGTGRIRGRHLADEGALVADQRRDEVELAREPQRARDHPTGDQAHERPRARGPRGSPGACRARSPGRRRRASRRCRVRSGGWAGWVRASRCRAQDDDAGRPVPALAAGVRAPAGGPRDPQLSPRATRATRGRPARSVSTVQVQPGRRSATQSTIACPWSAPISSRATPPPASATGNRSSEPADDRQSVRPAVEGEARLEGGRPRQVGHRVVADVGQVGEHEVEALAGRPVRQQVGDREARSGRRPRGRRRSRARDRARPGRCRRRGSRPPRAPASLRSPTASATAIAPLPVPTSTIRSGAAVVSSRVRAPSRRMVSACGELDQALRLRSRDQRSRIRLEREPVELLEPAQVGDRLAGGAALEIGPVAAGGVRADRCVVVGDHGRPAHADRVPEQQLGIEPWRLGSGGGQPLGALAQEGPGRVARPAPGRTGTVRRPRHRRRGGRPGRP